MEWRYCTLLDQSTPSDGVMVTESNTPLTLNTINTCKYLVINYGTVCTALHIRCPMEIHHNWLRTNLLFVIVYSFRKIGNALHIDLNVTTLAGVYEKNYRERCITIGRR